ncbi:MAG: hypothetical protein AAGA29_04950 [Planctomycetota bacterium]
MKQKLPELWVETPCCPKCKALLKPGTYTIRTSRPLANTGGRTVECYAKCRTPDCGQRFRLLFEPAEVF